MMNAIKLKDVCSVITDGSHYSPKSIANGFPMLSVKDMRSNGFDYSNCNHISQEDFDLLKKSGCVPQKNDVLIAKDGSYLKEIFVVEETKDEAILSSIGILRPILSKIDPYFLKYYLSTDFIKEQVGRKYVSGSALPRIILKNFKDIDIPCLPLETQKSISKILKNIDDKIINNELINDEIDSILSNAFQFYFIDFNYPNAEGKPYKLNNGKLVYNEKLKRKIPENWSVDSIKSSKLCKPIKAGVRHFDKKIYLATGDVEKDEIIGGKIVDFDNRESRANMEPSLLSVWFAKMKNTIKHISIPGNGDYFLKNVILSTGFQGIQCTNESFGYMHCLINTNWFECYKDILSHGATQESVNENDLSNILFVAPEMSVLKEFSNISNPLIEMKMKNIEENLELIKMKQNILPLLINGQLKAEMN